MKNFQSAFNGRVRQGDFNGWQTFEKTKGVWVTLLFRVAKLMIPVNIISTKINEFTSFIKVTAGMLPTIYPRYFSIFNPLWIQFQLWSSETG
jgi:hypothetical protein